jgi:hypothetical protein
MSKHAVEIGVENWRRKREPSANRARAGGQQCDVPTKEVASLIEMCNAHSKFAVVGSGADFRARRAQRIAQTGARRPTGFMHRETTYDFRMDAGARNGVARSAGAMWAATAFHPAAARSVSRPPAQAGGGSARQAVLRRRHAGESIQTPGVNDR